MLTQYFVVDTEFVPVFSTKCEFQIFMKQRRQPIVLFLLFHLAMCKASEDPVQFFDWKIKKAAMYDGKLWISYVRAILYHSNFSHKFTRGNVAQIFCLLKIEFHFRKFTFHKKMVVTSFSDSFSISVWNPDVGTHTLIRRGTEASMDLDLSCSPPGNFAAGEILLVG